MTLNIGDHSLLATHEALFTLHRMAFAPTIKPRWTGLPFTHKNGDFGAIL